MENKTGAGWGGGWVRKNSVDDGNQNDGGAAWGGGWVTNSVNDVNQEDGAFQPNERQPSSTNYENKLRRSGYYEDDEDQEDDNIQEDEVTSYDSENITKSSYGYHEDDEDQEDGALQVIDMQPSSTSYGNMTGSSHGYLGLESLAFVDQLILKQELEVMEIAIGFEEANRYTVFDTSGNEMFTVEEETSCCNRNCCGVCRSFNVMIMDMQGQPIIQLVSPNTCNCCCLRSIEVQSPPGTVIGFAQEKFTFFYPKIKIMNENEETLITANGPFCAYGKCCFGDADFVLTNNTGEEVNIHKHEGYFTLFLSRLERYPRSGEGQLRRYLLMLIPLQLPSPTILIQKQRQSC